MINSFRWTCRIEMSFLYTFPGSVATTRALCNQLDYIANPSTSIGYRKDLGDPAKHERYFRKWIPRMHNRMDKLTLTRQFEIQFEIFFLWEVSERNWNVIISIHTEEKVLYWFKFEKDLSDFRRMRDIRNWSRKISCSYYKIVIGPKYVWQRE